MIAVDTSALFAIAASEAEGPACARLLADQEDIVISSATLAEALIVAARKGIKAEMDRTVAAAGAQVMPVTEADAIKVAEAYAKWGKGVNPAGLNYGDCFAYVLARNLDCPLLFVGNDFSQTDVRVP